MAKYFVTGKNKFAEYGDYLEDNHTLIHAAGSNRSFLDVDTNISVRSEYLREDYNYFRSASDIGKDFKSICQFVDEAYNRVGIIKNVIDLMSDFGCKGIRLQHRNPQIQNFYQEWFKRVSGKSVSERFLNYLYKYGNVIAKSHMATIKNRQQEQWKKIIAREFEDTLATRNEIPIGYNFLNPGSLKMLGGEVATFLGKPQLTLTLNGNLVNELKVAIANDTKDEIPIEIKAAIKAGKKEVLLNSDNLYLYHYKKDDWKQWAYPIIYSLKDDLITYSKMRLADISAVDGAISNIRLWTMGIIDPANPSNSLIPTRAAFNKLKQILANNTGGGTMDLVWGPELTFKESNTQVHKFLGSDKYETVLNSIYDAMGIPSGLRSGSSASNNGSFLAFKTLVERLQYGRDLLTEFWNEQIEIVRQAMGFATGAKIKFDKMILADENQALQLLINLADRDYISMDSVLEYFDFIPDVEKSRIKREIKKRGKSMPNKASPFHDPLWDVSIKKSLVDNGANPKDVGINIDYKQKFSPIKSPNGRPPNVIETQKRKAKPKMSLRTKGNISTIITWANKAYNQISELIAPSVLKTVNKKNYRQLTDAQKKDTERLKFNILCGLNVHDEITIDTITTLIDKNNITSSMQTTFDMLYQNYLVHNKEEPLLTDLRNLYITAYVEEKNYGEDKS